MSNKKTMYLYILLLPIIDLTTSLFQRLFPLPLSFGVIIKGLFLLSMLLYTILKSTSKYKRISLIYSLIIIIYMIIYILTKIKYLDFNSLVDEIIYLFKLVYYPLILPNLICYFDDKHIDNNKILKILTISLIMYIVLLLIPTITSLGFNTYKLDEKGIIGWFYSANEVSVITIMLFPFIYYNKDIKLKNFIFAIISIITISFISTKTSLYGLVIITFLIALLNILNKESIKNIVLSLLIMILPILLLVTNINLNIFETKQNGRGNENIINKRAEEVEDSIAKSTSQETKLLEEQYAIVKEETKKDNDNSIVLKLSKKFLSSRDIYFKLTYKIYQQHFNVMTLLFGIGYTNNINIQNFGIQKLIEIDPLDIFFHSGFIALIIVLIPYIYYIIQIYRNKKITSNIFLYSFILLFILGISCLSGHILMAPAVSIYIVLYFILGMNELNLLNKKDTKINENKVTIYALHLNYGGIEKNICMKANILSEIYDVEIISVYKLDEPKFNLNKKVSIKYLTNNIKPNKEEFLNALHSKSIIKIIKEGLYSLKVLYLKNLLLTKSIINCNSKIIISTRVDFSLKLVKNNEYNNIKIAEEHIYHNNKIKYLNKINYLLKRIDYLMPSSDYLTNYYKDLFSKYSYKIITNKMPIETDDKISNLKEKIIITVGRLDKVKGYDDLIRLFSKINNKEWNLQIVGDGPEYNNLNNLISEYHMENNIKLLGYKNPDELNELYRTASIYVMTSFEESFGLVLLEAASHGLPIISYSSALGAKEILANDNGILIDNRNESLMIQNLKQLMDNIKYREYYQKKSLIIKDLYSFKNIKKYNIDFFENIEKTNIFMNLYKGSKEEFYKYIENKLEKKEKEFIVTANPETFILSETDKDINNVLYNKNNIILPDGISIVKTAKYLGYDIKERITGVDLAEYLLNIANNKKYKVYLFGASIEVIEKLEKVIKNKYSNINLVGATNGYIKDKDGVMNYMKEVKPDVILVALGIPKQEKLIYKYINDFKKGVFVGVGGSFDVISGTKKRAPKIFIKCNIEWLYRIICEPKRISRFIKYNLKFLIMIIKEKMYRSVDK